jgi:protein-tyrosine phosphatase
MINVLFVCLGNICRSPIAEGTFREIVKKAGLSDKISCDSAGTAGWHTGESPDHRTIKNAEKHGIKLTHKGRKITVEDLDGFQHIAVMDEQNFKDVYDLYYRTKHQIPPAEKLFLLRDYDPTVRGKQEVPDPYYEGAEAFENVYQIVWRSNEALLQHLIEKYALVE